MHDRPILRIAGRFESIQKALPHFQMFEASGPATLPLTCAAANALLCPSDPPN
jgi:hypothetical protein